MKVPLRCACGHHKAVHWRYGLMEGCGHHEALYRRCDCRGYAAISGSLEHALASLLEHVADCELDWALMDRIDWSLRVSRSRTDGVRSRFDEASR